MVTNHNYKDFIKYEHHSGLPTYKYKPMRESYCDEYIALSCRAALGGDSLFVYFK